MTGRVYRQVERDFGLLAPPIILHSPAPEPLAACWLMLRETLLAGTFLDRAAKEVVAASVALVNACPYCVDVHGGALYSLTRTPDAAALAHGRPDRISDPRLREIAAWACAGENREKAEGHHIPVRADQTPELLGVAVTFQYITRMVNVFLSATPLPPGLPRSARGGLIRLLGRLMRAAEGGIARPGAALELLPAAALPSDLPWAAGNPGVAGAFARAAAAIDAAAARSVPPAVRELLGSVLERWDGKPLGISRSWVHEATAGLSEADRPAGRLALLTALASYQVDESVVAEFRRDRPGDATLIELTSWASFTAARRVGGWLWAAPRSPSRHG